MKPPRAPRTAALALALAAAGAGAQYKVVAPDGSVTYTDRPAAGTADRAVAINARGAASAPSPELPYALRQAAARYPVVLYTAAECRPCDDGRSLLRQRGVPYSERSVTDVSDLERATGARTVPVLTVGPQVLRSMPAADWAPYLDAAGYPRESQLPRGWQPPAAVPLTPAEPVAEEAPARVPLPARRARAASAAEPAPGPDPDTGISF